MNGISPTTQQNKPYSYSKSNKLIAQSVLLTSAGTLTGLGIKHNQYKKEKAKLYGPLNQLKKDLTEYYTDIYEKNKSAFQGEGYSEEDAKKGVLDEVKKQSSKEEAEVISNCKKLYNKHMKKGALVGLGIGAAVAVVAGIIRNKSWDKKDAISSTKQ